MNRVVQYKNKKIEYTLVRKAVLHINIRVRADQTVAVSADPRVPVWMLDEFVLKKAPWILACFEKYTARKQTCQLDYVSGETVRLLGREYELLVRETQKERVCVNEKSIFLLVRNAGDPARKKRIFDKWYDDQSGKILRSVVEKSLPLFAGHYIPNPEVKIRLMKARWGSCCPKTKTVTFNKLLLQAPMQCIEYVVVHELAHFVHPNHSKHFYNLVRALMPDYKERKALLEK